MRLGLILDGVIIHISGDGVIIHISLPSGFMTSLRLGTGSWRGWSSRSADSSRSPTITVTLVLKGICYGEQDTYMYMYE